MLVWLARMFALACAENVHLGSSWLERAGISPACAEQQDFGDVAEIKPNASSIGAAIFADFLPDDVGFVFEPTSLHYSQNFW